MTITLLPFSKQTSWSIKMKIRPDLELLLNRFARDVSDDKIACMDFQGVLIGAGGFFTRGRSE